MAWLGPPARADKNKENFSGAFDESCQALQALRIQCKTAISRPGIWLYCWSSFWLTRPRRWPSKTASYCLNSLPPSIPCPAKASAFCICGRRIATRCAGCSSAEVKGRILRLSVLRFGQSQPVTLEICADGDRRRGAAKLAARTQYQQLLRAGPAARVSRLQARASEQQPRS